MLEYISLVVSSAALAWGWMNQRARREAEQRFETLRSSHYRLAESTRREIEALQQQLRESKREARRQNGSLQFEPSLTVAEAYELHPQAEEVFASFHLGGCSSCAVHPDDTIESAARTHGVDLNRLLATLNGLLVPGQSEIVLQQIHRQPNVSIQL